MKDSSTRLCTRRQAGYTLVELMVVVTIVGILASVAIPAFVSYLNKSKTSEAVAFLSAIKQRQAAYFPEMGQYCDVAFANPTTLPTDGDAEDWAANANWAQLGAAPDTRSVLFQYNSFAGPPDESPTTSGFDTDRGYGGSPTDFWFISTAVGDLDGDGTRVTFESYSQAAGLWISDPKGWE